MSHAYEYVMSVSVSLSVSVSMSMSIRTATTYPLPKLIAIMATHLHISREAVQPVQPPEGKKAQ